jgi:hypothetical protein
MAKKIVNADDRRRMAWQGGRGKNQLAVWRALVDYNRVMTTSELLGFVKPRLKAADRRHYWYATRLAAERYAVRVEPRTRPLKWRLKQDLERG